MSQLPADVLLRPATVDDADAGAAMHMRCWREAYGPIVDPERLDSALSDPVDWAARWREQTATGPTRVLAVRGREILGFATAGPARDPEPPQSAELYAIYVLAAWQGTGIAQRLLAEVLGHRPAYVWVLEDNARAIAFYARQGFAADGGRMPCQPLGAREVRMARGSMPT